MCARPAAVFRVKTPCTVLPDHRTLSPLQIRACAVPRLSFFSAVKWKQTDVANPYTNTQCTYCTKSCMLTNKVSWLHIQKQNLSCLSNEFNLLDFWLNMVSVVGCGCGFFYIKDLEWCQAMRVAVKLTYVHFPKSIGAQPPTLEC